MFTKKQGPTALTGNWSAQDHRNNMSRRFEFASFARMPWLATPLPPAQIPVGMRTRDGFVDNDLEELCECLLARSRSFSSSACRFPTRFCNSAICCLRICFSCHRAITAVCADNGMSSQYSCEISFIKSMSDRSSSTQSSTSGAEPEKTKAKLLLLSFGSLRYLLVFLSIVQNGLD